MTTMKILMTGHLEYNECRGFISILRSIVPGANGMYCLDQDFAFLENAKTLTRHATMKVVAALLPSNLSRLQSCIHRPGHTDGNHVSSASVGSGNRSESGFARSFTV